MKLRLQFFAEEGIGAEGTEIATQSEPVNETVGTENTEGSTSPEGAQTSPTETESFDKNAFAAQIRRSTEAEIQKKRDAEFARRYGKYVNPETGKNITSEAEYFAAIDAQDRANAREQLEKQKTELAEKGFNPNIIEEMINNSPKIREAEEALQKLRTQEIRQQIDADVAELGKFDPAITSLETVPPEVIQNSRAKGISLVLAYKDLYFGKVNQQQASAIQQRTINNIAGKAHLAPVNGVVQNDGLVEIPSDQIASWKEWYPDLSATELRKKYNRVIQHTN